MYRLCRLLLIFACFELLVAVCLVMFLFWPASAVIAGIIYVVHRQRNGRSFWAHGTARWATENDLRHRGMIGSQRGLAIGRICDNSGPKFLENIWPLFNRHLDAKASCEWSLRKRSRGVGEVVRLSRSVHVAVFAPTGKGKGSSFIAPWLFESMESQVVIDFKGELAAITARYREQVLGHRCVLLDPFRVFTKTPDSLNPFDGIDKFSFEMMDECRDLAAQLVIRTGQEREPHWVETSELFIAAAITAVAAHAEPDQRSLQTVRDILANPKKTSQLIDLLCKSEGMLPRLGGQLAHFIDKELASTLTTANRHLRFLDTPAIAESTSSSSFNPRDLRTKRMTVYCILPPHHMRAQSALMRMWVGSLMRAVIREGIQDV